jgi:hypothetical protein
MLMLVEIRHVAPDLRPEDAAGRLARRLKRGLPLF